MFNKPEKKPSLAALVMGVLFLLVGLVFIIGAWGAYFRDIKIQDSGASAVGNIEKKTFLLVADGDSDYILEYWFTTKSGSVIKAKRNVSKTFWGAVSKNQTIVIKYSVSNPNKNFPIGEGVTSIGMSIYASMFGALFSILGCALIWGYFCMLSKGIIHHSSGTPNGAP
jgi:hypothetical protein